MVGGRLISEEDDEFVSDADVEAVVEDALE